MSEEKKKKGQSIWLPLAAVLLVSGGWNMYMMKNIKEIATPQVEATPEQVEQFYLKIDPFTVNIMNEGHRTRLLYSGLVIKADNQSSIDILNSHLPQVKNRLISILSANQAEELLTPEGKSSLAQRVLDGLREQGFLPNGVRIAEVLFTDFVVQ